MDLSPVILRSWQHCRELDLQPGHWEVQAARDVPHWAELATVTPILEDLYEHIEGTWSVALVSDAEATVIECVGDKGISDQLGELGLGRGSAWREARIGTNALALAIREGHPLATVGAQHYAQALYLMAIAAAPLFGPAGQLLGAVAVVTSIQSYQAHTLGMVVAAAHTIHARLELEQIVAQSNAQITELGAALEAISEGLLVISPDGRIARVNRRVEAILDISSRAASGRMLGDVLSVPEQLRRPLAERTAFVEQEVIFSLVPWSAAEVESRR